MVLWIRVGWIKFEGILFLLDETILEGVWKEGKNGTS
jgi:hypothetical protein